MSTIKLSNAISRFIELIRLNCKLQIELPSLFMRSLMRRVEQIKWVRRLPEHTVQHVLSKCGNKRERGRQPFRGNSSQKKHETSDNLLRYKDKQLADTKIRYQVTSSSTRTSASHTHTHTHTVTHHDLHTWLDKCINCLDLAKKSASISIISPFIIHTCAQPQHNFQRTHFLSIKAPSIFSAPFPLFLSPSRSALPQRLPAQADNRSLVVAKQRRR